MLSYDYRLSNSHDGFHILLILLSLDLSCLKAGACAADLVNKYAETHDSMRIFIKSCVFVFYAVSDMLFAFNGYNAAISIAYK